MAGFADDDEMAIYTFDKCVEKLMDFSNDREQIGRTFEKVANATPILILNVGRSVLNAGPCDQRSAHNPWC